MIALDTETTGLSHQAGHRVIEIGAVEIINRRETGKVFHCYLQPDREVDFGAMRVHGITNEFLKDKPRFHEVAQDFKKFIGNDELIIHNAQFDIGFLNNELTLIKDEWTDLYKICSVIDTLILARKKYPGQKNNLDILCKRLNIDNSHRKFHGALLDAQILTEVYLRMTGGQASLVLQEEQAITTSPEYTHGALPKEIYALRKLADEADQKAHVERIAALEKNIGRQSLWTVLENE